MARRISVGSVEGAKLANLSVIDNTIQADKTDANLVLEANGTGKVTVADIFSITNSTASSSTSSGALTVAGGVGIQGNLYVGGSLNGGVLDGVTIGSSTPAAASFTSVTVSGQTTLAEVAESISSKTGATGTVAHDYTQANTWYHSSIASNFTMNLTNVPTTDNRIISVNLILIQGVTPYYASSFQIDGVAQTIRWAGYSPPSPQASKYEIQTFNLTRQSGAWTVFGSLASYS